MHTTKEILALRMAKVAHERACEDLVTRTEAAFPVGTRIRATLGNARIMGTVVSSGGLWWSRPDSIAVENDKTKKIRRLSATYEGHQIEILP